MGTKLTTIDPRTEEQFPPLFLLNSFLKQKECKEKNLKSIIADMSFTHWRAFSTWSLVRPDKTPHYWLSLEKHDSLSVIIFVFRSLSDLACIFHLSRERGEGRGGVLVCVAPGEGNFPAPLHYSAERVWVNFTSVINSFDMWSWLSSLEVHMMCSETAKAGLKRSLYVKMFLSFFPTELIPL